MADQVQWQLSGDYFENCNCSVVCPCLVSSAAPLTSRPTEGVCDVAMVFHVEKGSYGGVVLDGLNVGLAIHTPGPMGEGNWSVAAYIDQRADDKQTDALGSIFTGAAGGPMAAFAPLIAKNLGAKKVPITYRVEGKKRSAEIPTSCICRSSRCQPCIRAGRCGRMQAIRSVPTSSPSPWERREIRLRITGCAGTIPERTDTTRPFAGPASEDVASRRAADCAPVTCQSVRRNDG